jgi:hypothetical protein
MSIQAVLLPLFVEVALTFALLFATGHLRVGAIGRGEVKARDIALGQPNWPDQPTQCGNAFNNQFQLPVLFYVLTILAWITHQADLLFVVLACVFVILRLAHAGIHVTSNQIRLRFFVFAAGAMVLLLMWVIFALRILLAI